MNTVLPESWLRRIGAEFSKSYFQNLAEFVDREREERIIYPGDSDLFTAFRLCPFDDLRVVILGQDPYHGQGQAHGLAFSVRPESRIPPSLSNIFAELESDLGIPKPPRGLLSGWARQGVLLLNAVLTVREGEPNSHRGKGWEIFTDSVIRAISEKDNPVVFILWGNPARQKAKIIDSPHFKIESPHPSPLSAHRGFFGSKPFSTANLLLEQSGQAPIDWSKSQ